MKVVSDLHTHSKYSKMNHGKNTIEEMVQAAIAKGLKKIAITDHGSKHMVFGIKKNAHKKRYDEIVALRKKYPEIEILCGVECNLLSVSGKIDLPPEQRKYNDICLMGYHIMTRGSFNFAFKTKKRNTRAFVNAINNNKIDIVTHLQQYIKVDAKRVAEAAAKNGTLIELNNRHFQFTEEDVKGMLETDVRFVINSDAHKTSDVGEFGTALEFVERFGIPKDRIVNLEFEERE